MPKGIGKSDWDTVHQLACDVANAAQMDDDVLLESKNTDMLELLASLQKKYGDHPSILATIADYLDDPVARRAQYEKALAIAREQNNQTEIDEIVDSLRDLDTYAANKPQERTSLTRRR